MEKQRQLEWEKQRIAEMQLQRQREQEKVLKLKAQNQSFTIELSTLNRIELGKAGTSLANIFALCEALKIQPKELFEFELPARK